MIDLECKLYSFVQFRNRSFVIKSTYNTSFRRLEIFFVIRVLFSSDYHFRKGQFHFAVLEQGKFIRSLHRGRNIVSDGPNSSVFCSSKGNVLLEKPFDWNVIFLLFLNSGLKHKIHQVSHFTRVVVLMENNQIPGFKVMWSLSQVQ